MIVKKAVIMLVAIFLLLSPVVVFGDECFEGDCDNGLGKGFTEDGKVYEGQWQDGEPHGLGKLFISRDEILKGQFEKGQFVGAGEQK